MTLALNKPRLDNLTNEIWKSAERLRGKFKAYQYQNVILPMIAIRRLECVLLRWRADKKAEIRASEQAQGTTPRSEAELDALVRKLEQNPKQAPFSNNTRWTLRAIYNEDHALLEQHFRAYVKGFSANVQEIIDHFDYRATIGLMVKNNRLAPILNQYKDLEVGPDQLSNLEMGYVYEELLRRFSEQSGEEAGEHFTPREVIRLMVELLDIPIPSRHLSIYDPACGTGGMLSIAKEHLLDRAADDAEREAVERWVTVHGQELSPTNYAICKSDLLIKDDRQAVVLLGNSLIPHDPKSREPGDQLAETDGRRFDFMLSNPPFGVTWGGKDGYEAEARRLQTTRYRAGMPTVRDGALLFLQTMLAKMKPPEDGGSRIAIIFNGSPLSNGDCGQGESEIRRWILENDWLDAIVMLPDQLFYNTGIFTYIWLLRSDKPDDHEDRVMLIDARSQFEKEPKSFGNKRHRMTDAHRAWIEERYREGWRAGYADEHVKLFRPQGFAFHKVSVVFWQHDAHDRPATITEPYDKTFSAANLRKEQQFYDSELRFAVRLADKGGERTEVLVLQPGDSAGKKYKALMAGKPKVLGVEWTHRNYVKDDEYIPFGEDIAEFLAREIDREIISWEDSPQLGYEILPTKYFYRFKEPSPAKKLIERFWSLERQAERLLAGLSGA